MGWLVVVGIIIVIGSLMAVAIACYHYTNQAIRAAEAEFPPQGKFVKVVGVKLHYVCKGSGQPVVLLHGNPGFLQDYAPQTLDRIAQKYTVYAFDRPGHGWSDRPIDQPATPLAQAQLLRGALQKLNIEKPILVGYSWSSALVLAYALRYPEELSGIVLLSAISHKVGNLPLPPANIAKLLMLDKTLKIIPSILLGRIFLKRNLSEAFSPATLPMGYLKAALALWTRPRQIKAALQDGSTLQSTLNSMKKRYGEINLPIVIVTGDSDNLVSAKDNAYRLHSRIPQSRLIILPNTGHAIPQTQPEAIVNAIDRIGK